MMQMWEILKELNEPSEVVSTQRKDHLSKEALKRIEKNITLDMDIVDREYRLWSDMRRKAVYHLREISREWCRSIEKIIQLKLAAMDDPIYFIPLFETLKKYNIPIIAFCHNLETLAPEQLEDDPNRTLFNKEIDLLAQCHLVITISREETFLLHNLGIKALFFPYYSVKPILNRLLRVREKRKKTKKKGILLLGNALNLQTRQGMEKVILFWQSSGLFKREGKLLVAGYSTEKFLKNGVNNDTTEFFGTLSSDRFDNLLCNVKVCLCFQESGAGALTRICEMLIAGVPVLANSHAARSYYNVDGVIEFFDLRDLERALNQVDELDGQIPIPQKPDSSHLVSEIKKIMEQHSSSQSLTKSF